MTGVKKAVVRSAVMVLCFPVALKASGPCDRAPLLDEHKDVATVQKLETAWSIAYLKGDAGFERCLLTPDFTEIVREGDVKVLKDELGFAEANLGKNLPIPDLPKSIVLLHGDVAVAYGTSRMKPVDGRERSMKYADYYVWEDGGWHAFFAQQTMVLR
jgi:Domain of unknown function (DUF4440)